MRLEREQRIGVGRGFCQHALPAGHHRSPCGCHRGEGAGGNDDLVRPGGQAFAGVVIRQGQSQRFNAQRVVAHGGRVPRQLLQGRLELFQHPRGCIGCRAGEIECGASRHRPKTTQRQGLGSARHWSSGNLRDGSRALAGTGIAAFAQFGVGTGDRGAAQAQAGHGFAFAGQYRAMQDAAIGNKRAQGLEKPPVGRLGRVGRSEHAGQRSACDASHKSTFSKLALFYMANLPDYFIHDHH